MAWLKYRTYLQGFFYDRQTQSIIRTVLKNGGNGLDVGCHKGEILDFMISASPKGEHIGIEPIPSMAADLSNKYADMPNVQIVSGALASESGESTFQFVKSNPAFSGLKQRSYLKAETIDSITVPVYTLDEIWPENRSLNLVKIDVEGGELGVLEGGRKMISQWKPVVIFEHGLGAADHYGTSPKAIFHFFESAGMNIYLMKHFLRNREPLSFMQFEYFFLRKLEFYFVASAAPLNS